MSCALSSARPPSSAKTLRPVENHFPRRRAGASLGRNGKALSVGAQGPAAGPATAPVLTVRAAPSKSPQPAASQRIDG
jgi:hypothetical protein